MSESVGFDLALGTLEAGRLKDRILYQVHRGGVIAIQPGTGEFRKQRDLCLSDNFHSYNAVDLMYNDS